MNSVKALLVMIGCCALVACNKRTDTPFAQDWQRYAEKFYSEGRIIDTGNDNVSHSEGQGYAMLFAAAAGDKVRFDELWQWTSQTLQRQDGLFSWRYRPCPQQSTACVDDPNNASDGDILIAWALLRASKVWRSPTYKQQAMTILSVIENKLIVERQGRTLLLPAEQGFVEDEAIQLNLSYWIFPAFADFHEATGAAVWQQLNKTGMALLAQVAERNPGLPGDWMWLKQGQLSVTGAVNTVYGFNACRIPLHLVWQDPTRAALLKPYKTFWQTQHVVPATLNLATGDEAGYRWTNGMRAIAEVVKYRSGDTSHKPQLNLDDDEDYFSSSLIMLSQLSLQDNR